MWWGDQGNLTNVWGYWKNVRQAHTDKVPIVWRGVGGPGGSVVPPLVPTVLDKSRVAGCKYASWSVATAIVADIGTVTPAQLRR